MSGCGERLPSGDQRIGQWQVGLTFARSIKGE
jgi:hypothetical protein